MDKFYGNIETIRCDYLLKATPYSKENTLSFDDKLNKELFFTELYTERSTDPGTSVENDLFDKKIDTAIKDLGNKFAKVSVLHISGYAGCGKTTYIHHLLWTKRDEIGRYDVIDYEGCKKACVEAGLDPEQSLIYYETQISPEHGYKAVMDLFYDGRLDTCDAIFAGADFVAYGALKALHDLDIDVPGQIGLIGFDDLALSQFTIPALTTVQQPRFEIGEKAASMLLDMIDKKDAINSVKLKPVLVVRDSV